MKFKVGDTVTVRKDLKTGWYGDELVVPEMLVLAGEEVEVKRICESDNTLLIVGSTWNWTNEMLVDKPSGKIIGYRCLDTGGKDSWWSVGKVYTAYKKHGQEFIIDDERDERFLSGQSLEAAIKYQNDYYGTVFEPVYVEPSTEDLIERIKEEIERLNKDQENLFGKRDRINEQAIKLGSKARKLEEVLEVLEEYK